MNVCKIFFLGCYFLIENICLRKYNFNFILNFFCENIKVYVV